MVQISSSSFSDSIVHAKATRSCFSSYKSLKNDQATRLFFFFFFSETKVERKLSVQTAKCIAEGEVWGQDYPASRGLDGEATECRLCKQTKHCGCMLNTDYVSQVAQRKLTRMPGGTETGN